MTEQECQTLFAWLIRREHLTRKGIHLKVKAIRQGHAHYSGLLTIPEWALKDQYEGTAYTIHEVAHFVNRYRGDPYEMHGKAFKRVENRLLKLFGLSIDRKRAYAKATYYDNNLV